MWARDGRAARSVRSWPAFLLVTLLLTATGCAGSEPSQGATPTPSPATATPTSVPSPTTTTVPTTSVAAAYFVSLEKMAPAQRQVSGPGVAAATVRALLLGPTSEERVAGMSSAVPAGTQLRSLSIREGTAIVDLSGAFASGGGSFSMGARTAQLITTLTQFPTVKRVRLWLDGKPATTLGGEGLVVDRPLSRLDVEEWLPTILLDTPAAGATINSPVRVRGSANVFEAVLFVEVTDWDGRIVATRRVMASAGTGTRGTFDVRIPYQVQRSGPGEVIVYSLSPKDGARTNVRETPVRVTP